MQKGKDISNMLTNGAIFSTFKHSDPHTVCGRSTLKDGVASERIFRYGSFCETNQMFSKGLARTKPEIKMVYQWVEIVGRDLQQTTEEHWRKF